MSLINKFVNEAKKESDRVGEASATYMTKASYPSFTGGKKTS